MMSTNNILSPANGKPIIVPSQDMVLGIYYMTRDRAFAKGEGKIFSSPEETRIAYDAGEADLQAKVKVRMVTGEGRPVELVETTVGRILLREIVPAAIPFEHINRVMTKKQVADLIDVCFRLAGNKETVILADRLKETGFRFSTIAGISICLDDMVIPAGKEERIDGAVEEVKEIQQQYTEGLITDGERYNKVIDIWAKCTEDIAQNMLGNLGGRRDLGRRGDGQDSLLQRHPHDGRFGSPRQRPADPAAGRDARPDGQALRRDH
jgi:DNA-directed RNA polymerase subunit beta'